MILKKTDSLVKINLPSQDLSCVSFLFLVTLSVLVVVLVPLFPRPLQRFPRVISELHDLCENWNRKRHKTE